VKLTKMTTTLEWASRWGRPSLDSRGGVAIAERRRRADHTIRARLDPLFLLLLITAMIVSGCHRDIERSLARAVEAWDSGDYNLAAEEYERYLQQRPSSEKAPDARFQLANIYYFKLRRYDQARDHYNAFLEKNPSNPNSQLARERLAEVLGEMGRSYEAIAEYENLSPRDSGERRRIRLRIADLYFAQRNYSQALTEYEKVIEQVPYDDLSEQAYLREASIYHIERGQYLQALPVYQKLAAMSGEPKVRTRAMYGLAECHAGLFQFDEAIRTLRGIKDEAEHADIARRVTELEQQKREAGQARSGLQK
jgi:tetratricopeptide (TPR) repeat protein